MNRLKDILTENQIDALIILNSSNIKYATGFLADYCYVLITGSKNYYFTDGRFTIEAKRDLSVDWEVININSTNAMSLIKEKLVLNSVNSVGFDSDISHFQYLEILELLSGLSIVDVTDLILCKRIIKEESEINNIIKAQGIAEKSLTELKKYIKIGVTEKAIAAKLEYLMMVNGSDSASFKTIVAFGENSAIAHAKPSNRELKVGDIILIDFGAMVNGYCSDMTRTFVFGSVSDKIKEMYDAVLKANIDAIASLHEGVTTKEIDQIARKTLKNHGYLNYFTHSLGHGVGIDIHEKPFLSERADDVVLKENMVVTIEPGIYLEGIGGIRIEDMIVVKANGNVNLSASNKNLEILNR